MIKESLILSLSWKIVRIFIILQCLRKGASNSTLIDKEKVEMKISQGSIIHYDPNNRRRSRNEKEMRTPRVGLSHEL